MEKATATTDTEHIYKQAIEERGKHVEAILLSESMNKVVVAGPGTGKTYLFKEILKGKKNTLTLSFVNALVDDLALELYGLSDVKTLHSFGRSILAQMLKKKIDIYPQLSNVIKEDFRILQGGEVDFDILFNNRDDTNEHLKFYEVRRQYYGYYGFTDVIFAAVKSLEADKNAIPVYEQVLVDEFQDFNKLEVSLIDLLAEKSPTLLAGDDDQALYEFKSASASHIRDRHSEDMPDYASFNLPFCARCSRVIVDATNDLIQSAKKHGLLNGRIDKPYTYFEHKDKNKISNRYPKIAYKKLHPGQEAWFIEKCIGEMAMDIKDKFSVLVISPFKKQSRAVAIALKGKGLNNIEYPKKTDDNDISILDGFKLLMDDKTDNLGWCIVSRIILSNKDFVSLIKNTHDNPFKKVLEYLPADSVQGVKEIVKALKYINAGKTVDPDILNATFKQLNIDPNIIATDFLQEEINTLMPRTGNPAIRKIPIKATTIQSSKGLAADVVFITHFDDRYFISNKDKKIVSDRDLCNFLVALTRTKKKVFLISSVEGTPTFLKWISNDKIETIK